MRRKANNKKRMISLMICLMTMFVLFRPISVSADEKSEPKVVRVGWYKSPYNIAGADGGRSGYGYDYQQAVAAYTGWEYEYVSGEWYELLQMLENGEIDLLTDVSYKPERENDMLFSALPMGEEQYYIYADLDYTDISISDISSLNGKKVGIIADSIPLDMFANWAEQNEIQAQVIEMIGFSDVKEMLQSGALDCIVSTEATEKNNSFLHKIAGIGGSDIYFAINKERGDLKEELDDAMNKIAGTNPFFDEELYRKYIASSPATVLSSDEIAWLEEHGRIKIAYLRNNLAFSGIDPDTGELIGALAEYINFANTCMENRTIEFEAVPFDNICQEMEALKNHEVDVIFPLNRNLYYAEENALMFSDTVLTTPMAAVTTDHLFNESEVHTVAFLKDNIALKLYLTNNYPDWEMIECTDPQEPEQLVRKGRADCFITSAHKVNNYYDIKSLYCVYLSKSGNMAFISNREDTTLMSILNKTIRVMPDTIMSGALSMYANPVRKTTFKDFMKDNAIAVSVTMILVFALILATILLLLKKAKKAEALAKESEKNAMALNEELQKNQENLKLALAAAEHANAAKTTFLNNMSHDIRTPMNAIIGFTALAASHIDNKEAILDYLGKISTSSNHLLSLINDVLDMSRIESGKMVIDEKEVHLPDIFHDLRVIVQPNVTAKQQDFFIDTQDVKTEYIISDKLRLNQVFLNIITNAIKFTPVGGTISIRIIERPCSREGYARFEFRIKDTGIGMSKEFQEHIFEAFTRERSTTMSGIPGTGLGMAITKNIVDMLGGTIEVVSEEGKGSEFIVELQCKIGGTKTKYEPIPELENFRALVVDDNADTCISVSKMLREIGMRPDWTTTGKESIIRAKEAFEEGDAFKAYIIDWLMPDMNGIETVRRIRQVIGDSAPIIILTAYDWADIEEEALQAGVTAFVSKPLFMSDLREVLTRPICAGKMEETESKLDFQGKKILLVEDNELNQEVAVEILQESGFVVEVANDGVDAVEIMKLAKPDQYDVILMDVQMPLMNGYEATRQIRKLQDPVKAKIPIIAMTANAFDEDRQAAFDAGMNGFVLKPIEIPKLIEALENVLGL
ncbi:MAG: response regulator [Agathobacter sp.]